ncbi:plant intracellular Ras-group-related LRR protein 5-like [Aristolochia californica]|uniref:plant intracellular Ras-group-related LRR protein 5-like n=1 Tax=Aristolochia californica TaxID=171875 RepID=UPI0035D92011
MAISGHQNLPGVVEVVDEIMKIMRSLPPRPTIDDVVAAISVVKTVDSEEQAKLDEISKERKPPDVPDELFSILQEVRKNMVVLQAKEQRKEALHVIELDKSLQAFDELIQRTSRLVSGDAQNEKDDGFGVSVITSERKSYITDESFQKKKKEETQEADAPKGLPHSSSLKVYPFPDNNGDKLSLIKVASVIETTVKTGADELNLQGKLMDQIEWLPQSLGKLSGITELNLSENRLMALPSNISGLKCLTKLDIHSNQLINLPEAIGELSSLVDLDLHANLLKSLPTSIGNLTNIVHLDLSSNQLSVLPETIGNLTRLKRLNVEINELGELPYTVGSWTSLIELRLDFNQLKALPEAIGKLENLELLSMHYNRVKALPTTMGSLSKLKELDVSFNELESVPENLCFATSLVKLNVGRNFADLRSLPRSIGNLEMLEELDISNNQIRVLPESFRFLSKLRVFHADETPLEVPPKQVVKLGAQAVVEYMANLIAKKDVSPVAVKKKGFWYWVCSLFQPHKKTQNTSVVSIPISF